MSSKDLAAEQLKRMNLSDKKMNEGEENITTIFGKPISDLKNSLTIGPQGPILLQDVQFIEELAHFDRERIPERVVHAKGAGAFGYFEVTSNEIAKYCKAKLFDTIGRRTSVAVRFSTVGGESGSADTVRDPRGFAIKFYTEQGNWDLVGNNTPIFFIRDPILFPSFIHTQKRNPKTNLKDANMFWDFFSLVPAATHQFLFLFSDRGIPDGYRHMNGYGSHTFKLINDSGEAFYTKFHFKTQQGIKNLPVDIATRLAGEDPDYSTRDLYNAIENKNYPKWKLFVQIMTFEQAKTFKYNPFDLTKIWSHKEYPLIEVGNLVLDRNPRNYFAEIEQIAFCPANMIPGIEPSPDRMLIGRLFSYSDTQRHRLGANFHQLPVNRPKCPMMNPTIRDGPYCFDDNFGEQANYWPNSFTNWKTDQCYRDHCDQITGQVDRHDNNNDDNFEQATDFWTKVLNNDERERLVNNIAEHLRQADTMIQEKVVHNFDRVHPDFGGQLRLKLNLHKNIEIDEQQFHSKKHFNKLNFINNNNNHDENSRLKTLYNVANLIFSTSQRLAPICQTINCSQLSSQSSTASSQATKAAATAAARSLLQSTLCGSDNNTNNNNNNNDTKQQRFK